jgi:hypothetical protein
MNELLSLLEKIDEENNLNTNQLRLDVSNCFSELIDVCLFFCFTLFYFGLLCLNTNQLRLGCFILFSELIVVCLV